MYSKNYVFIGILVASFIMSLLSHGSGMPFMNDIPFSNDFFLRLNLDLSKNFPNPSFLGSEKSVLSCKLPMCLAG